MSDRTTLVIATGNRSKILELTQLLADLPVDVVGIGDVLPEKLVIDEDQETFEGNALKKANTVAAAVTMLTLADDSGLEVDALGGRPGVRSARFAHERATDAENNAALLSALTDVDPQHRTARFRCVLALVDPWAVPGSPPVIARGTCEGSITREPHGGGGFGYDPLFLLAGQTRTMAELDDAEKNAVSHRGRALAELKPKLATLLKHRADNAARIAG